MMATVGDIGLIFELTIAIDGAAQDISDASTKQIIMRPPRGVAKTFTAEFSSDGTDGMITYTTAAASDLDQAGVWQLQGYVSGTGFAYHTDVTTFDVGKVLS